MIQSNQLLLSQYTYLVPGLNLNAPVRVLIKQLALDGVVKSMGSGPLE